MHRLALPCLIGFHLRRGARCLCTWPCVNTYEGQAFWILACSAAWRYVVCLITRRCVMWWLYEGVLCVNRMKICCVLTGLLRTKRFIISLRLAWRFQKLSLITDQLWPEKLSLITDQLWPEKLSLITEINSDPFRTRDKRFEAQPVLTPHKIFSIAENQKQTKKVRTHKRQDVVCSSTLQAHLQNHPTSSERCFNLPVIISIYTISKTLRKVFKINQPRIIRLFLFVDDAMIDCDLNRLFAAFHFRKSCVTISICLHQLKREIRRNVFTLHFFRYVVEHNPAAIVEKRSE